MVVLSLYPKTIYNYTSHYCSIPPLITGIETSNTIAHSLLTIKKYYIHL